MDIEQLCFQECMEKRISTSAWIPLFDSFEDMLVYFLLLHILQQQLITHLSNLNLIRQ